jgi:hypothetical protein
MKKKPNVDKIIKGKSWKNVANTILLKEDMGEKEVNRVSINDIVIIKNKIKAVKLEFAIIP